MIGGERNTQYNADDMAFGGPRYDNIRASGNASLQARYSYNTTINCHPARLDHSVSTKPADDPVHANFIRACSEGQSVSRLRLLISRGADIEYKDHMEGTPLHHAAFAGHLDTVRFLLDAGVDIHAFGTCIGTPLCLAVLRGHSSVVDLLLERNAGVLQDCGYLGSAAHAACFAGSTEILLTLVRKGANLHAKLATSIAYFTHLTKPECMSLSTSSAYNLAESVVLERSSPGCLAVVRGHQEVVGICLDLEHGLAANERLARYRLHIRTGVENPIRSEVTLVMVAVVRAHVGLLSLLLETGADVTAVDSERCNTLFYLGAGADFMESPQARVAISRCISILLLNGLDVNATDRYGRTALMDAANKSRGYKIAKGLLDCGASVNAIDNRRSTALMEAAVSRSVFRARHLELLCERGSDVNLKDIDGNTALDRAALYFDGSGEYQVSSQVLLRYGAAPPRLSKLLKKLVVDIITEEATSSKSPRRQQSKSPGRQSYSGKS